MNPFFLKSEEIDEKYIRYQNLSNEIAIRNLNTTHMKIITQNLI